MEWMQKLFGFGGGNPQQNMLMMAMNMLANSSGQGFGQGMGNAFQDTIRQASMLEQLAFRRASDKERLEIAKGAREDARDARQEAQQWRESEAARQQEWRQSEAERAEARWLAETNQRTEHARMASTERQGLAAQRPGSTLDEVEDRVRRANPTWTEDQVAADALQRWQDSVTAFNPMSYLGGFGQTPPGGDSDAAAIAAIEAQLAPQQTPAPTTTPAPAPTAQPTALPGVEPVDFTRGNYYPRPSTRMTSAGNPIGPGENWVPPSDPRVIESLQRQGIDPTTGRRFDQDFSRTPFARWFDQ